MSLLNQLCNKRSTLKPTQTCITYPDGRKFIESASKFEEVAPNTYGYVVDTKPDDIPAKITDNVFLGSQDCCELKVLNSNKISCVLSVGIVAPFKYDNVAYKFVQCLDLPETNLKEILQDCLPFIESATKNNCNILIHCNAGVSRSASVVIGYLILICGLNFSDAFQLTKRARHCIRPNDGFLSQLKSLSSV